MINKSELIINPDGSVFHLHTKPGQVATTIFLVGDPARCEIIAQKMDIIELRRSNREMHTITGSLNGKRFSVVSTGIGCDNIDIVMTELDALFNVDFQTRTPKKNHTQLTIIRLGTSGALNPGLKIGDIAASEHSVGIDGLAYFYQGSDRVRNIQMEERLVAAAPLPPHTARPYIVAADRELLSLFDQIAKRCTTISASGFYAPQGRVVRLPLAKADYLEKLEAAGIDNFEMEGAAIYLLAKMLNHRALTLCAIIAQRAEGQSDPDYGKIVEKMIDCALLTVIK